MKAKTKNHEKLYPAIYIEWCDAMSGGDNWIEVSDALLWGNNEDWKIKQFGFLLKETKEYILLAAKLNAHENETMISHPVKIPKTWIRKRINLTKFISSLMILLLFVCKWCWDDFQHIFLKQICHHQHF